MKIQSAILFSGALLFSGVAVSQAEFYSGGSFSFGNLSSTDDTAGDRVSWDNPFMLSAHIGQRIDFVRAELELGITSWEGESRITDLKQEADLLPLMVNLYGDLPLNHHVELFAMVGAGTAFVLDAKADGKNEDADALTWAVQAKIGANYYLANNLNLFTAFRFMAIDDIDVKGGGDLETPNLTAFELGARYWF